MKIKGKEFQRLSSRSTLAFKLLFLPFFLAIFIIAFTFFLFGLTDGHVGFSIVVFFISFTCLFELVLFFKIKMVMFSEDELMVRNFWKTEVYPLAIVKDVKGSFLLGGTLYLNLNYRSKYGKKILFIPGGMALWRRSFFVFKWIADMDETEDQITVLESYLRKTRKESA